MSLSAGATNSQMETIQWWPELILVALVITKIALGILADRVGREGQIDPASTSGSVAWDDRTGSPVVVTVGLPVRELDAHSALATGGGTSQGAAFQSRSSCNTCSSVKVSPHEPIAASR
jgi:hypothetical protein